MHNPKVDIAELRGVVSRVTQNADEPDLQWDSRDGSVGGAGVMAASADLRRLRDMLPSLLDQLEQARREVEVLTGDVANLQHSISLREADAKRAAATQAHTEGLWHAEERLRLASEALVARLRTMLQRAENQFRYYAEQHRAKNTPEADEKAVTNEIMADACAEARLSAQALQGE